MKKLSLIWIIGLFLLALPSAFAKFPYSDILLISSQKKPKYLSKVGQVSFRSLTIRMLNLSYPLPFIPFKGSFAVLSITSIIVTMRNQLNEKD